MGKPTECVRAMLDERGVTYDEKSVDGCGTLFSINLLEQCDDYTSSIFVYNTYIEVMRKYLTPEQAIAATLREYTYEQWRAISEIVGNAMEYAHDVAIRHPDKADPCWDLSNYVDQILEVAFGEHEAKLDAATVGGEADVRDD